MRRTITTLCLPLGLLAACSDDAGTDPTDGGVDSPDPGGELLGTTTLLEVHNIYDDGGTPRDDRYGNASGFYVAGRMPRWHREVARAGDCVLLRHTPSLCTPACTDGLCVDTNVCEPFTTFRAAGAMTVTGLTAPLTLTGPDGYYYAQDAVPADLFRDDATVTASLAGAAYPAHAITTGGVPPLVAAIDGVSITLVPGQDHVLRWTPATTDARVRVTLNANNRGHGMPYLGIIECDAPDSAGQVTIAAALVDGFPETQAWTICAGTDCPPSWIRRYRRGTTAMAGGVAELIVGSQRNFGVEHHPAP